MQPVPNPRLSRLVKELQGLGTSRTLVIEGPAAGRKLLAQKIATAIGVGLHVVAPGQAAPVNRKDSILFFDEADSLFGRRTEVKDSHDRYANLDNSPGLTVIGVNCMDKLPTALKARAKIIHVGDY